MKTNSPTPVKVTKDNKGRVVTIRIGALVDKPTLTPIKSGPGLAMQLTLPPVVVTIAY